MSEITLRLSTALADRYKLERRLGEGGMATVYLAEDLKHKRNVALKVLKPDLAAVLGAERFVQEITTTASLQHPHILPLFDSGTAGGSGDGGQFLYYVMPYVEGETLRDKLDRETQLSIEEAVQITTDVAEALQAAHEEGVIHRDIKPENVLLHKGRAMVADFGIALAVSAAAGGRMTETGLSLGTPHYMSPEQATADKDITARSDVYSLGTVLYEMLTGEPPHMGTSAQQIIMKIVTEDVQPVTKLRKSVPPNVTAAVAKALERLAADRFGTAREFHDALRDPEFTIASLPGAPGTASAHAAALPSPFARWLPWSVATAALALAAWSLFSGPQTPPSPPFRTTLSEFVVVAGGGRRFDISRDGSTIVAVGPGDRLYVRHSDDLEFRPIPGTEQGLRPSISPDGEWLAFRQDGAIRKVQLPGGPVLPVVSSGAFPHWYAQDGIVYYQDQSIYRVSSAGGQGTVIAADAGPRPFMLPGGRAVLHDGPGGLYLRIPGEDASTLVASGGSNGRYVSDGHVLFGDRELQSVFAVPFDLDALEVTGPPVPVLPSVNVFAGGAVQLAVSDNGTLLYLRALAASSSGERFTWFDLEGTRTDLGQAPGRVLHPRVSPDGRRVAYTDDARNEVVVYDLSTGAQTDVTQGAGSGRPVWSPDGTSLYVRNVVGQLISQRVAADGSGVLEELDDIPGRLVAVSPDEAWGVVEQNEDLWIVRLDADSVVLAPYLRASWDEREGAVSPNGRWLAYSSNEGNTYEVYVRSFPEPGPAVRVSSGGGRAPVWAPDGSAIYFLFLGQGSVVSPRDSFMRRDVRLGETVQLGEETPLFPLAGTWRSTDGRMYDIHPDGDRFLFLTIDDSVADVDEDAQGIGSLVVVVNWFEELRERVGR